MRSTTTTREETTMATTCCDGTGWTGNEYERCVEHYEPLDSIWNGR
jgi:hypothetical protein